MQNRAALSVTAVLVVMKANVQCTARNTGQVALTSACCHRHYNGAMYVSIAKRSATTVVLFGSAVSAIKVWQPATSAVGLTVNPKSTIVCCLKSHFRKEDDCFDDFKINSVQ